MTQTDDARSARVRWLGSIAWRWFEPQIALAAPQWCPICLAAAATRDDVRCRIEAKKGVRPTPRVHLSHASLDSLP